MASQLTSQMAPVAPPSKVPPASSFAAVNFAENDRFIRLSLDLPGVTAKDIGVEMQRGVLLVRGTRETDLGQGVRHQHKFCRRFAMDTDVVNIQRIQANLNKHGVLVIMAPKMRLPTTLQISVTEHDDDVFEGRVAKSFVQQQENTQGEKKAAVTSNEKKEEEEDEDEDEGLMPTAAPLPNVVSVGSASEALDAMKGTSVLQRKHKSSMKSHLMIRRSMSKDKLKKTRNAQWAH